MQKDQATCGLGPAVLDVGDGLLGFGLMPRGRNADLCAFKTPNWQRAATYSAPITWQPLINTMFCADYDSKEKASRSYLGERAECRAE